MGRLVVFAAVVAVLTAGGVALGAATDGPVLNGTVGPGFSISLRDATGSPVSTLAPGPVTIDVDDLSEEHNFHLTGPGVDVTTQVEEIGKKNFALTLVDGVYKFVCDPHNTRMRGQFTVGTGGGGTENPDPGTTTPKPSAPVGSKLLLTSGPGFTITLKTAAGKKITRLKPGRYTIVARDRSSIHNAHVLGAGVNKKTSVAATGTQTWKVVLKKGTLIFQCDPHKTTMRGKVVVAP